MTDTEKVLLCQNMIADFWGFGSEERQLAEAETLIMAITSVLDFAGEPNGV